MLAKGLTCHQRRDGERRERERTKQTKGERGKNQLVKVTIQIQANYGTYSGSVIQVRRVCV